MPVQPEILLLVLLALELLGFSRLRVIAFSLASLFGLYLSLGLKHGIYEAWHPFFNMEFSPVRCLFAAIISGLGFVVAIYSSSYLKQEGNRQKFFGIMGLFQWSCLTLVFSNHALLMATAWELTAVTSFLLIGYKVTSAQAQKGAFQALLITGLGGLCFLGAMVILAEMAHTYQVNEILIQAEALSAQPGFLTAIVLMILAVITKSAQVPFHFWLPDAMHAPTPVSAYLHSATLVKLGVFAAALFWPLTSYSLLWHVGLSGLGLITFAWGASLSLFHRDLKAALAHTTFSQIGLMLMLFSQRSELAFTAGCAVVIAHALYKSTLFLSVGIIADGTKTQDIREMNAFGRQTPHLWFSVILVCASMAGIPFFLGASGKDMTKAILSAGNFASAQAEVFSWVCFVIGSVATTAFAVIFCLKPFLKEGENTSQVKLSNPMLACIAPLAFLSFLFGVYQEPINQFFGELFPHQGIQLPVPSEKILGAKSYAMWAFLLPGLGLGFALVKWKAFWRTDFQPRLDFVSLSIRFQRLVLQKLTRFFDEQARYFEALFEFSGLKLCLLCLIVSQIAFITDIKMPWDIEVSRSTIELSLTMLLAASLSIFIVRFRNGMVQAFILGAVGYLVAFCFAIFGAPDLVLTQVIVETASLALLVFAWLNCDWKKALEQIRGFENIKAWCFSIFASVLLVSLFFSLDPSQTMTKLSSLYFFENAKFMAAGTNLVNVVLVDFRAMDTLGEISVLGLAYMGAYSLAKRRSRLPTFPAPHPSVTDWMRALSKYFVYGLVVFSVFYLLRGHNAPGGGFIGGLLLALALFVRMMTFKARTFAIYWTTGGLGLAYITALAPALLGQHLFEDFILFFGPTSLIFDIGVYACVAGAVSGLLEILMRMRARSWAAQGDHHA